MICFLACPAYSMTISPQSISLLQNNPLPWIEDLKTPTASLAVLPNCLYRIAMGSSKLVARLQKINIKVLL